LQHVQVHPHDGELELRQWNPADIGRFMLCIGPISSAFDIITIAVMWWVFDADRRASHAGD